MNDNMYPSSRMNCNLFWAIKRHYVIRMLRYCNAWSWKYLLVDTFRMRRS